MACKTKKAEEGKALFAKAGKCGGKVKSPKKCVEGGAFDKTVKWG